MDDWTSDNPNGCSDVDRDPRSQIERCDCQNFPGCSDVERSLHARQVSRSALDFLLDYLLSKRKNAEAEAIYVEDPTKTSRIALALAITIQ